MKEEMLFCVKCNSPLINKKCGNPVCARYGLPVSTEAPPPTPVSPTTGYEPLHDVLLQALNQASHGKGKERHANGKPFLQQPIMEIGRMVGTGYHFGQAMKKIQEASRLPDTERKVAELLGAINYIVAAVILLREAVPEYKPARTDLEKAMDTVKYNGADIRMKMPGEVSGQ